MTTRMTTKSRPMRIEAYAKINLTLEVLGKRADGYHALRSIVQPIALADTLEIEETDDGVIATDTGYGEEDLIVKAARILCGEAGVPRPRWRCGGWFVVEEARRLLSGVLSPWELRTSL